MSKISLLLGKKIFFAIALGGIGVGALIYMGVQGSAPASASNTASDSAKQVAAETDPNYVNTQWNDAVGGTKGMPENWPKDAPVAYVGATLMSSLTKDLGTGKLDPSVVYFSDISGPAMIEYYVKSLESNGWKIEANADSVGYRVITAKKDIRAFFAFVSVGSDGKTGVTSGVTF